MGHHQYAHQFVETEKFFLEKPVMTVQTTTMDVLLDAKPQTLNGAVLEETDQLLQFVSRFVEMGLKLILRHVMMQIISQILAAI